MGVLGSKHPLKFHSWIMKLIKKSTVRLTRRAFAAGTAAALALACLPAHAQLDIEITGVGSNLFPLAVPGFSGQSACGTDIGSVISSDLQRSGKFRIAGPKTEAPYSQVLNPTADAFKSYGVNAAALGSVVRKSSGWELSYKLFDVINGTVLDSASFSGANARLSAHKIADRIYQKLTGMPGCFASRIAYVQRRGSLYELIIADSDGENPRVALRSREPIISPVWSPNGSRVAYVSFESRKPVVFIHELSTGKRRAVAQFPGNNSAPAFSPDGSTLAVALSRDGGTQIYLMSVNGGAARRFTTGSGISTEPVFSPDGAWIYFTSDRGGKPQIYRKRVSGGSASRVTFGVSYAVSPALSPDGKKLAYIARTGRGFQVNVLELATGSNFVVSRTGGDESPSFSPNGELILYASGGRGSGVLYASSADGKISTRLSSRGGSIREPAWGPLVR